MTARYPLVLSGSDVKELQPGDTLYGFGPPVGMVYKGNKNAPMFTKTGNGAAVVNAGTGFWLADKHLYLPSAQPIIMPTLNAGADLAIWAKDDGATFQASESYTVAPGAGNWTVLGGFHFAPGGNATANAGGNNTPQINEYSFWDSLWLPSAPDPRGMACIAGGFWRDIYALNTAPDINGTSKYNKTIADGGSPPIIPAILGGNGSTTYGSLTWFESVRIAGAFGKRLISLEEQIISAFGTTEQTSYGSDPGSTICIPQYTSKWGIMQASGCMWYWLSNRGGAYNTGGWSADTEGYGSSYNAPNAAVGSGYWGDAGNCGSSCSFWNFAASHSHGHVGVSFGCDHRNLAR